MFRFDKNNSLMKPGLPSVFQPTAACERPFPGGLWWDGSSGVASGIPGWH